MMNADSLQMNGADSVRIDPCRVFCDFDGTITTVDIGYDLFDRYGSQEPWHGDLIGRSITIERYWRGVASTLREPITDDLLERYFPTIPIDPGFDDLLRVVREHDVPFAVVSDGLDLYIERYLASHGHEVNAKFKIQKAKEGIGLYCNHAATNERGELEIAFPFAAEECRCPSAVCKRNVVITEAGPDERIIYIGDGLSDFCPAGCADVIFAKGELAAYCNENGLPHYPFRTLKEVAVELDKLLSRRRIRPRHQAELARKRAFEEG